MTEMEAALKEAAGVLDEAAGVHKRASRTHQRAARRLRAQLAGLRELCAQYGIELTTNGEREAPDGRRQRNPRPQHPRT